MKTSEIIVSIVATVIASAVPHMIERAFRKEEEHEEEEAFVIQCPICGEGTIVARKNK